VVLLITTAGGISALLWMRHSRKFAPVSIAVAFLTILSAAFFPVALRGDWWVNMVIPEGAEAKPNLSTYAPFSEGTAKLGEESTLVLKAHLPRLDGATALYPVYAALAEAVYDKDNFSPSLVQCTNTRGAYKAIMSGERDIVFVAIASKEQLAQARGTGKDLKFTPIGREAFVFLVGKYNPVENLSYQQIRNIFSGKTANWGTIGWPDGGRIIAFQRPEGSGSQTGLQNIMGELPIQVPQPLPDTSLIGTNSLMKQISVKWQGVQPALGYSYRYYATTMYANQEAKLLSINRVEPSIENIRNGEYPFIVNFYAVTAGAPKGNSKLFIDWILSPQGQKIIEKTGYTPIK
ncbi:substrate-binding domain-containing protein, partial [Deltaproteobacteria bacterium OttesenSCG-928-M10]|nr:substrate-binding domain-containing protein [Deltaproteobacteria bacterium OttesenSCG-928-M10]